MILITKGGLSRGGDNEMPENCLYDCRLRDTCIYVPRWADEETLLRIGTERSKSCPLVQVYEVPKETEQERTVMYERKDEPQSVTYNPTSVNNIWEKPTNPYVPNEQTEPTISKMEQVDKDINVRSKDEEYINNLPWTEVGNGEQTDDAYFLELMGAVERGEISDAGANQAWYEYINHKDEPQTCEECEHWSDTEDGCADRYGCKTEPQTDCPWK